jgi:hypothetical protein
MRILTTRLLQDGFDAAVKDTAMRFTVGTQGAIKVVHHSCDVTSSGNAQMHTGTNTKPPGPGCAAPSDLGRPALQLFLLRLFLECLGYPSLLVLPESFHMAPDALAYFAATQWLVGSDRTLWCILGAGGASIGQAAAATGRVVARLTRTDFVAGHGAGWLVSDVVGRELLAHWRARFPPGAKPGTGVGSAKKWLTFLRTTGIRRGRQCIVPAVPRVINGGHFPAGGPSAAAARKNSNTFPMSGSGKQSAPGSANNASGSKVHATAQVVAAGGRYTRPGDRGGVAWMDADISWLMESQFSSFIMEVSEDACSCKRAGDRA